MPHLILCRPTSSRDLSPPRQKLVELCTRVGFGRLIRLAVVDGEPVLDPKPLAERDYRLGGDLGPQGPGSGDFLLKKQHLDLIALLDEIGTGEIAILEVRNGLPFQMTCKFAAA